MTDGKQNRNLRYTDDEFRREVLEEVNEVANTVSDGGLDEYDRTTSYYTLEKEICDYLERRERGSLVYQLYPGAEMESYDFTAERHGMYNTNLAESTAHIIKGCLGAGILSMHEGFMYGGLWTSLFATVVVGIVVGYSMHMLIRSSQIMYIKLRITKLTYPDLAEVSIASSPWKVFRKFSKPFRYLVEMCIFLEMCGTCCIYQIMIANTVNQVFEGLCSDMSQCLKDTRIYIMIITAPLVLLCLIRNLKFLAPFSMIADIFVAICVLTTLYYSLRVAGSISDQPGWKGFGSFTRFCGICLYSVDGVAVCLPIENNMRRPKYFPMVIQTAMSTVVVLTALTGFFGYWGWGEDCRSPLTVHMPINIFTTVLQILLAMMLCVTFAIQFWVPFRIVWYYIGRRYKRKRAVWERFYRVIHVLLITGTAIAFPNLIKVMVFLGNFFIGFIAFVFPAVIETLVTWTDHRIGTIRWKSYKNLLMFVVGVVLSGSAFYTTYD